jgi:hypothetical protein
MTTARCTPPAPIDKAFYNPPTTLTGSALRRSLELHHPTTVVTPYHRDVLTVLLEKALCLHNCELGVTVELAKELEEGLYQLHSRSFVSYAEESALLLTLFARSTATARFALSLTQRLYDDELDARLVATMSDEELFPELYDNHRLSATTRDHLQEQLQEEVSSMRTLFVRTVLSSLPPEELRFRPLFGGESLYNQVVGESDQLVSNDEVFYCTDYGQSQCFPLLELLTNFARGDYFNPQTRELFADFTKRAIEERYHDELAMLQHYVDYRRLIV